MKKILPIIITVVLIYGFTQQGNSAFFNVLSSAQAANSNIQNAYNNKQSNIQVMGKGRVIKILSDDIKGSKHQRFILKLASGLTVLVAHNIDLAPRINAFKKGSEIVFYGEYEWNKKGGVIHWTHHDPAGHHVDGWLKHQGQLFQ